MASSLFDEHESAAPHDGYPEEGANGKKSQNAELVLAETSWREEEYHNNEQRKRGRGNGVHRVYGVAQLEDASSGGEAPPPGSASASIPYIHTLLRCSRTKEVLSVDSFRTSGI